MMMVSALNSWTVRDMNICTLTDRDVTVFYNSLLLTFLSVPSIRYLYVLMSSFVSWPSWSESYPKH